mgnify:CR=1 FL=1
MSEIPCRHPSLVVALRNALPYINAHRGRVFVIVLSGETVQDDSFPYLIHDIALLAGIGVRLVLVHGARPQIEERLRTRGVEMRYGQGGVRVTDEAALTCVMEAAGTVRVQVEALLSMGLANSPMAGARIRVISGNFVIARPLGVRNGLDYQHTGEVRRVDGEALRRHLDVGDIVLLPPLGYSPTGEVFNLSAEDVATATAVELAAHKLVFLVDGPGLTDALGEVRPQLTLAETESLLENQVGLGETLQGQIGCAVHALRHSVDRVHLLSRHNDGALLSELFTRDGVGTLLSRHGYDDLRTAQVDDVAGIQALIRPLEEQGVLVRRSRERLETEIGCFVVAERDGTIIACAALYPFEEEQIGELACVAVHPDYRSQGRGDALLAFAERTALTQGLTRLFVLTTHTSHWFQERGFEPAPIEALPVTRRAHYNHQRGSRVLVKNLS